MKPAVKYLAMAVSMAVGLVVALQFGPRERGPVPAPPQAAAMHPTPASGQAHVTELPASGSPINQPKVVDRLYEVESAVARARARGADENEVYRLRAQVMSAQEIALITERERNEQEWNRRVTAFQSERTRLGDNAAAVQALRDRLFTTDELARLDAQIPQETPQLRFE